MQCPIQVVTGPDVDQPRRVRWYRFKSDAADLEFVEKVARWLTNTQVQIKSEVANSNSQCQAIEQSLNQLETLVKSCEQSVVWNNDVSMLASIAVIITRVMMMCYVLELLIYIT